MQETPKGNRGPARIRTKPSGRQKRVRTHSAAGATKSRFPTPRGSRNRTHSAAGAQRPGERGRRSQKSTRPQAILQKIPKPQAGNRGAILPAAWRRFGQSKRGKTSAKKATKKGFQPQYPVCAGHRILSRINYF